MAILAQFSTDNSPESVAIRWATNGEFSHVDLILPDGGLLGARSNGGVAIRPMGYKNFSKVSVVWCDVPNEETVYAFAKSQIGKPYNFDALLDMVLHRVRNFYPEQPSWFCDELLYACISQGGLNLLNTVNPLSLTPQEVYLSPYWKPNVPQNV